jgi:hypothetical protein
VIAPSRSPAAISPAASIVQLHALPGHADRFAEPVDQFAAGRGPGHHPGSAAGEIRAALASQDRSADTITAALFEAFSGSARAPSQPAVEPLEAAR